jgi:protein-S-isoprenylcysteine O-methyltransferase Ste14
MLLIRSVFFTIVIPGTVTVLVPYLVVSPHVALLIADWNVVRLAGSIAMVPGLLILLKCIWDFGWVGGGTLAPIDPPTELVVSGLYRYVRNPMYLGVFILLLGEVALFQSTDLLEYTAGCVLFINLTVVFYEEPALRRKFGRSYERYCETVSRWLPRRRA